MLYFSLCLSGLLLAVVNAIALWRGKSGVGTASLLSAAAIVLLFCTPLLGGIALLVALAGAICWGLGARPRWFLVSSVGVTILVYGLIAWKVALPRAGKWEQLKATYPIESLADRLQYEERPRGPATPGTHDPDRLSDFEKDLEVAAMHSGTDRRTRALEYLHAGVVKQFVESPGFGIGRRVREPRPIDLEATESWPQEHGDLSGPIPQMKTSYYSPVPALSGAKVAESDFAGSHEANLLAFLHPFDFGYVRDRGHVAGFRPHRFHRKADAPRRWQVERLELLGLLKYDEPVVYLSQNLPTMDELRDAPTRPLDTFEQEALDSLRRGEDLMVQEAPDRMRMLGSLRAGKQCLRCHEVERGELLGAFSYQLVREGVKD
ncbi:MAG TPA: hypothetical protein VKA46_39935 [Gemmataceae bacterium]|nr:hypothetical protein [Gemmataceae bacterium]